MNLGICLMLTLMVCVDVAAQTHHEKISKEFTFEKKASGNTLMIANINGGISVQAYEGEKIQIEVTKTIHGKTPERLDEGKKEIQLGVVDLADTIILFVDSQCNNFEKSSGKSRHSHMGTRWGYTWYQDGRSCHERFDYSLNFAVKLPLAVNLLVSTINNGDIIIKNVGGVVIAHNVNGNIRLQNLTREAEAHTVNGDVDIEYAQNPKSNCKFYTLNGDINALFQKGLTASMGFQSFNGSLYTNIDRLESLPAQVEKKKSDVGTKYKVSDNRYQIGKGGAHLDFETFNGNVYVKEKLN